MLISSANILFGGAVIKNIVFFNWQLNVDCKWKYVFRLEKLEAESNNGHFRINGTVKLFVIAI